MKIIIYLILPLFLSCSSKSNHNTAEIKFQVDDRIKIVENTTHTEKNTNTFKDLIIDTLENGYKINRYDGEGFERYNLQEIFFVHSLNEDLKTEENRFGNYFFFMLDMGVLHISGSYKDGIKNGLWLTLYEDSPLLDLTFFDGTKELTKKIENSIVKDDLGRIVIEIIEFIPTIKLHYKKYSYNPTLPEELSGISEHILENILGAIVSCKVRYGDNSELLKNASFDSYVIRDGEVTFDELE